MNRNDIWSLFNNPRYMKTHADDGYLYFKTNDDCGIEYVAVEKPESWDFETLRCYAGGYRYPWGPEKLKSVCSRSEFKRYDHELRMISQPYWDAAEMRF